MDLDERTASQAAAGLRALERIAIKTYW